MSKETTKDASKVALARLTEAHRELERARKQELKAVLAAREAGVSWAKIGELYGLTKQGAQQRFKARAEKVAKP